MRLSLLILYAKDLPLLTHFYAETLGGKIVSDTRTDTWVEVELGPVRLGLHAIPDHIAAGIPVSSPPEPRENTPFKPVFDVDSLDATLTRLRMAGIGVIERPWGGADVVDPEGNIFHIR